MKFWNSNNFRASYENMHFCAVMRKNIDVFVVGLLKYDSHPAHASFDEIMEIVNYIQPKKMCILTHMTALIDYDEILTRLPDGVFPGYDGFSYEF